MTATDQPLCPLWVGTGLSSLAISDSIRVRRCAPGSGCLARVETTKRLDESDESVCSDDSTSRPIPQCVCATFHARRADPLRTIGHRNRRVRLRSTLCVEMPQTARRPRRRRAVQSCVKARALGRSWRPARSIRWRGIRDRCRGRRKRNRSSSEWNRRATPPLPTPRASRPSPRADPPRRPVPRVRWAGSDDRARPTRAVRDWCPKHRFHRVVGTCANHGSASRLLSRSDVRVLDGPAGGMSLQTALPRISGCYAVR